MLLQLPSDEKNSYVRTTRFKVPEFEHFDEKSANATVHQICFIPSNVVPSFYMNVGHFSEYSGHPNNKFQTFLKNSRVQVGVYL